MKTALRAKVLQGRGSLAQLEFFHSLLASSGRGQIKRSTHTSCKSPPGIYPSGTWVLPERLSEPVYDCYQAALARNIEEGRELKTLVMENRSRSEFYVFNLPGDRVVPFEIIRKFELRRADIGKCNGTLNPWTVSWNLRRPVRMFFCDWIWKWDHMMTNAGELDLTLVLYPDVLRKDFDRAVMFTSAEWPSVRRRLLYRRK